MSELLGSAWFPFMIKLIFGIIIAMTSTKVINKIFKASGIDTKIHLKFIKNMLVAFVWIAVTTSVISQINGFNKLANTILAGSGILAAILGLAAQESFSNLFSGLFISMFRPFDIGDRIRIVGDDTAGYVEDLTLRHTIIRTYTNVRIIIPNSIIGSSKIENSTYSKGASYPIEVDVAYEGKNKRRRAIEIMEEVISSHPDFYDTRSEEDKKAGVKPITILCTSLGASGIHLKALMWTENFADNQRACSECRLDILDRFEEEGIEVTYNKLVVYNNSDK